MLKRRKTLLASALLSILLGTGFFLNATEENGQQDEPAVEQIDTHDKAELEKEKISAEELIASDEEVTVTKLTEGYKNGDFQVREVVEVYLERIDKYEDTYNAFTFLNENAMEQAKEIDQLYDSGKTPGRLAGVPIAIKEAVDVVGFPSTFGWKGFSKEAGGIEIIPQIDAPIVEKLKDDGAIILGKTNIPAFSSSGTRASTSWDGETLNAIAPAFVPGGSSSGTATSVSGNLAVLGIAEETGGSIQNPAAAQSIVGVKPTFGLVPNTGATPLAANTRDVLGPHARTIKDAAIMLDVIAGYHPDDPKTEAAKDNLPNRGYTEDLNDSYLEEKRIGLYGPGWHGGELSKETRELYNRAVQELEEQGAIVVKDPFADSGLRSLVDSTGSIGYRALVSDFHSYIERMDQTGTIPSAAELFRQVDVVPWAEGGPLHHFYNRGVNFAQDIQNPASAPDLNYFFNTREKYLEIMDQVMEKHNLDAFAFPQMEQEIPKKDENRIYQPTTSPEINISGQPLVTIPAGYYESGAPFSLAFFGDMWSEAELLGMAYDYEQATHYREAPDLESRELQENG
ncbi:amidase [Halobacillus mangrovi]|uniref:amidase n=1 Tax=Halobacillus mangrovi TaxID=402384 RepID=UPI003D99FCA8